LSAPSAFTARRNAAAALLVSCLLRIAATLVTVSFLGKPGPAAAVGGATAVGCGPCGCGGGPAGGAGIGSWPAAYPSDPYVSGGLPS
jgi:hypothetical protein